MATIQDLRITKGMELSESGRIQEMEDGKFSVPSMSSDRTYTVTLLHNEWTCDCPDFFYRHVLCKHIYAVRFWITVNHYIENEAPEPKVFADDAMPCDRCGSIRVMRYGRFHGKQRYYCKDCKHKFCAPSLLKKAKYDPEVIVVTLDLYFKGLSLRKISDHLAQFNQMAVPFQTVHKWLDKYVTLLNDYVSTLTPQLSGKWHEDEMKLKVKGGEVEEDGTQWKWLWNVMDKGTRFQLASEISKTKNEVNSAHAFLRAKEIAKALPRQIVTDKAGQAPRGIERAFINDPKELRPEHTMINTGIGYPNGNQWAERLNNTVRERTKIQRGWKADDTPLKEGQRLYYNFIRENQSLGGLTPAEMAGLYQASGGENRWMELLKKAVANRKATTSEDTL
jgi:transposase-like protein